MRQNCLLGPDRDSFMKEKDIISSSKKEKNKVKRAMADLMTVLSLG